MLFPDGKQFYKYTGKELVLRNCFLYDISMCNIRIIKQLGFSDIYNSLVNLPKQERVIKFGYISKQYKQLAYQVNNVTTQIIKQFINEYNIQDNEIVFIQKDGILVKRYINVRKEDIEDKLFPELHNMFSYIVFNSKKTQYLAKCEKTKTILTKGIQNKSIGLDSFLTKHLYKYDIGNFDVMNQVINKFFESYDIELYTIEKNKDMYFIVMQDKILEIRKDMLNKIEIDTNKINKHYYFNLYLEDILKSIIVTYI